MKKIFYSFVWFFVFCFFSVSAQELNSTINNDPNVKIGKLDNGLTYYIRENKMPANRVEFRLAVNAGSNQENDNQQGLAHFTEHMAFNGIKGFPGNQVIEKLQEIGVSFGGGINAYTSFDETVYMITMPSDQQKYVDMGLSILAGWANGLLYNSKEIDAERGVISEEYRMSLGAENRMQKVWWPQFFKNMQYAHREPIGLIEIINGFEYQTIKDFYHDWYRPDLQAVIVVGDINAAEVEQMIIKKFSKIKPVKNPREKVLPALYTEKGNQVVVCKDKEAMGNLVEMLSKYQHYPIKTVEDYRNSMIRNLYNMMIASRLMELRQNPNSPFINSSISYDHFIGNMDVYSADAICKENKIDEALKVLIRENNRILKYGFLESELKRAKEEMMNNYEKAAKEIDKTTSENFAKEYVNHFLHQDPIPGAKRKLKYAQKYLEGITLDEVNALAKQWVNADNKFVLVTAPDQEGVKVPTEQEIRDILNDKSLENVEPYVDTYKDVDVIDLAKIVPGTIAETKELAEIGAKELVLSNGVKVILKKTDFKNDEILFEAKSRGGLSQYGESEIPSCALASSMIVRAGIGELDFASLSKKMKGKNVTIRPTIDALSESLSGSMAPKDMEFFFQYLNAFFTNTRHDTAVAQLVVNEYKEQVAMLVKNPLYQFIGKLTSVVTQNDPYQQTLLNFDENFFKAVNYESAYKMFQQRFSNPADFDFVFVGNFDETQMNKMLETYLASIPTSENREDFNEVTKGFPENSVKEDLYLGKEDQSWVGLCWSEEYEYNQKNNMIVNQIAQALDIEVVETIREKMSGVYSPQLECSFEKYPKAVYDILVLFSCSPSNTDTLSGAVIQLLKNFQQQGPKPETLQKVQEQMIKEQQSALQKNSTWLSFLSTKYFQDETNQLNSINDFEQRVKAITNEDIVNFMKRYFAPDHKVRVTMYPENMQPAIQSKKGRR